MDADEIAMIATDVSTRVSDELGRKVVVRLVSGERRNCVWLRVHAAEGPLSHARGDGILMPAHGRRGRAGAGSLGWLLDMPHGERVTFLTSFVRTRLLETWPTYEAASRALEHVAARGGSRLDELKIGCDPMLNGKGRYRIGWSGWGSDLTRRPQTLDVVLDGTPTTLIARIETLEARDATLEKGVAVTDVPLARLLDEAGSTTRELLAAATAHGLREDGLDMRTRQGFSHAGTVMALAIRDGVVRSDLRISDTIRWRSGCVVAQGVSLPLSMQQAVRGRPLEEIVDHRWLKGLVATAANQSQGRGGPTLTITAKAA